MLIREATPQDSDAIAEYMLLAMEEIVYAFIGERNKDGARAFLKKFNKLESNQYSFQNCWVAEVENEVVAAANVYDGADLYRLREPIIHYIHHHFHTVLHPEDETQAGEFYIDFIGVKPQLQGKGIGSAILWFLINKFVVKGNNRLGLLVDEENPVAEKLYLKLGFKEVGQKILLGKRMKHLQM